MDLRIAGDILLRVGAATTGQSSDRQTVAVTPSHPMCPCHLPVQPFPRCHILLMSRFPALSMGLKGVC
jgi:hypothetical protein